MDIKPLLRMSAPLIVSLLLIIPVSGCALKGAPQSSASGFIREELFDYRSIAILPFEGDETGEVTNAFANSFRERFPQIEIIGQRRIREIFGEEDLGPDQWDERMRREVGEKLGAQALIAGNVYYPSILRWLLQVKIMDTETGRILGRSLAEINYMGALGFKEGCDLAVQQLQLR